MHAFGGIVLEASCGEWWIGGVALGNGDIYFCRPRGGSRGGGTSISVGLAEFCLGVDVWWRGGSQIHLIPWRRVVPQ